MHKLHAFLAAGLALVSAPAGADDTPSPEQGQPNAAARMLALGDSYTIGESVAADERWPAQLALALERAGIPVSTPRIIARTGWSTTQLDRAITSAELQPPYDLVTLLIGVNDQFRKLDEGYPERFQRLLERSIELAGGDPRRALVVSIPDYGVTPFGRRMGSEPIGRAIDEYNRINRERAGRAGVAWIDITPISREAESDGSLVAPDGLHPSSKMYTRWVERILPLARGALQTPRTSAGGRETPAPPDRETRDR